MKILSRLPLLVLVTTFGLAQTQTRSPRFTIDQVLSPAFPYGRVAARTTAPSFTPVRLTSTTEDDGVDLRPMQISDDGAIIAYIRGHAPGVGGESDMPGWIANPVGNPDGGKNEVWAANTTHAQIFLPPDLQPGEKRPALLFIHGGSRQRTLLGYHYQQQALSSIRRQW